MERGRSDRRSRKVSGRLPERFLDVASDPQDPWKRILKIRDRTRPILYLLESRTNILILLY